MKTAILVMMGAGLVFGQAVTSSTDSNQSTTTVQKLDGSRSKTVVHHSAARHTSDSYGNATSRSNQSTTVTKDKGDKKVQSTTSSSESSSVHP